MTLDSLVAPLRADVVSGASVVARTASEVVRRAASRISADSPDEFRATMSDLLVRILDAQPAMAPLVALARDVLLALDDAADVDGAREAAAGAASAFREFMDWCGSSIAERTSELIPPGEPVLTLSSSATVRRSLEDLAGRGGLTVYCLEARPMSEGRRLAQQVAAAGASVVFAVDAAGEALLDETRHLVLGADSLGDRGVVNKIGSAALARGARDRGIPVHVLLDRSKFLPPSFPQPTDDPRPGEEVWRPPPGVQVWNRYFEAFPHDHVTNFVTESGVLIPEAADELRRDLPVPEALRQWAERWSR
jgi:translation initiation factor 2B subunit (eIF-2B alpha/beta/delta family)